MNADVKTDSVSIKELKWDTDFFGVSCAKVILYKSLLQEEWDIVKSSFDKYQFISIENKNSDSTNAQLIGRSTLSFLADVNIQFLKKIEEQNILPKDITIHIALEKNDYILNLAVFQFSKFIEDPELLKRGGAQVYNNWLNSSFNKPDKYFALHNDDHGKIDGFVLFNFRDDSCVIELIAVSKEKKKSGIGTALFNAVEYSAKEHGCNEIKVGTQARNIGAINFYHKCGCRQVGCHQIYHLWNT